MVPVGADGLVNFFTDAGVQVPDLPVPLHQGPPAVHVDLPRLPRLLCACGYACFVGRPVAAAAYAEQAMRLEAEPGYESCEPGLSAFIAALANVYAGRLDRYLAVDDRISRSDATGERS